MLDFAIINPIILTGQNVIVARSDFKVVLLLTGLVVLAGGLWSAWHHCEHFRRLLAEHKQDSPALRFERRKHQRRSIVAGLMASCGIVLAGFFWVEEGVAFSVLLAMLLLLLLGIAILAMLDMVSIGLKHSIKQLAESDSQTDQAIADAIAKYQKANRDSDTPTDNN